MNSSVPSLLVIGGGAAGFFAAITAAESGVQVTLLEQSPTCLGKVKVSGGGRCNVTHHCLDPKALIRHYPRGGRELLGPFHKWGPAQTIEWFERRGVKLKVEEDGRMFPVTDDSMTVVNCLLREAQKAGVKVHTRLAAHRLEFVAGESPRWRVHTTEGFMEARQLLIATGSSEKMWLQMDEMKIERVNPVPSLFTFHIADEALHALAGLSVDHAIVSAVGIVQEGPMLITHWGLSGPAVLKLSAWAARKLNEVNYAFELRVNWTGGNEESIHQWLAERRKKDGGKICGSQTWPGIARRLWHRMLEVAGISSSENWANLKAAQTKALFEVLFNDRFEVRGKSTFKEEFVTAGGVKLSEVDFRTMACKKWPGLHFAGEVLDIDAVTGGFNFQAAWTTGYLAGRAVAGT